MEIITDINQYKKRPPLALSIGMFDGVHLGHCSIIKKLKQIANEIDTPSALLSFSPHPRLVFNPNEELKLLNTASEKQSLLENLGIDYFFIQNFDESFRNLTGEEFVKKILINQLNVRYLIIGYDHTFGKNKSGDFHLLKKMSEEYGFQVLQTEAIDMDNQHISSTKIRTALRDGLVKDANRMLGYDYEVSGKVIHGKKIGRTIGFPTANMLWDKQKLLPKEGAYIVSVKIDHTIYNGMLSIGTNPTVEGNELTMEVHIIDFKDDIYNKEISVIFHDFLHEQIKFESLEALIQQLNKDKELTKAFFRNRNNVD